MNRFGDERGSLPVLVGVVALVALLALALAGSGILVSTYARAATAADAAALAAAPVTFHPFGARGSPTQEAGRLARVNGARLVACECAPDPTWVERTVTVTVERVVTVPWGQTLSVRATSRATFDPVRLLEAPLR